MTLAPRVVLLCGGVGGAKLALGLDRSLPRGDLAIIVNTGDDFDHLGLRICPDLDTVLYTLAGVVHPGQGWGRADETFSVLDEIATRGGPAWFRLGDRDLALHLQRTASWGRGERLTRITADLAERFEVGSTILPMTDSTVATRLETVEGTLEFQEYFVRRRCEPIVQRIEYVGADEAVISAELSQALASPRLERIVIAPSNPLLSIAPILALPGMHGRLRQAGVPIIAVAPLIGGRAIKGPTAKLMQELGLRPGLRGIAEYYANLIDALIIDSADGHEATTLGGVVAATDTLMQTMEDRLRVAQCVLELSVKGGRP
ncbi:MAG: 2-phospho-L-lactate transferase [Steroidobacteraceae bacterium]